MGNTDTKNNTTKTKLTVASLFIFLNPSSFLPSASEEEAPNRQRIQLIASEMLSAEASHTAMKIRLPLRHIVSFMSLLKLYGTLFQSSQAVRDGRKIVWGLKALEQKRRPDLSRIQCCT
jgi:hypothetical protein